MSPRVQRTAMCILHNFRGCFSTLARIAQTFDFSIILALFGSKTCLLLPFLSFNGSKAAPRHDPRRFASEAGQRAQMLVRKHPSEDVRYSMVTSARNRVSSKTILRPSTPLPVRATDGCTVSSKEQLTNHPQTLEYDPLFKISNSHSPLPLRARVYKKPP